jgi:hypothetical protein
MHMHMEVNRDPSTQPYPGPPKSQGRAWFRVTGKGGVGGRLGWSKQPRQVQPTPRRKAQLDKPTVAPSEAQHKHSEAYATQQRTGSRPAA